MNCKGEGALCARRGIVFLVEDLVEVVEGEERDLAWETAE